jgi:PAS domain S-box-containing protein
MPDGSAEQNTFTVLIALLGGGALTAILTGRWGFLKEKLGIDNAREQSILTRYEKRITELEDRVDDCEEDRARLREDNARLGERVTALSEVVGQLDSRGRIARIQANSAGNIVGWNSAATLMFGYTESQAKGASIDMLIPPEHQESHSYVFSRALNGESEMKPGGSPKIINATGIAADGREIKIKIELSAYERAGEKRFAANIKYRSEDAQINFPSAQQSGST